jgi:hypothetical protein
LRKDAEGVWRGQAEINGTSVNVTLHTDGNITENEPETKSLSR